MKVSPLGYCPTIAPLRHENRDTLSTRKSAPASPRQKSYQAFQPIEARNQSQEKYLDMIEDNIVTFGLGPAGTGKTYIAVYQALCHLWSKKATGLKKIILTRPVVEAGEKLGYLPGALEEKMDPYMRPLYDSIAAIVGPVECKNLITKDVIEIAPVAYMRGRTFSNAFVILDEAQNCTAEQLKMVLTRLGENVKLIVSGDVSQSDLNGQSGLQRMVAALEGTKNIGVMRFRNEDAVRSEIVRDILVALGKFEKR